MKAFIFVCSYLVLAGCYVEDLSERTPSAHGGFTQQDLPQETQLTKVERRRGECFHDGVTGCLEGNISSAMNLSVSGKAFFDADDLANRFHEIVEVRATDGKVLEHGKDYRMSLTPSFSNQTFAQDFQVFIKGERPDAVDVRSSGKFFLNQLPEGEYEIRVQRPIRMLVELLQAEGDPIKMVDCATLYQDGSFEIIKGEKAEAMTFDDLKIYTTATACNRLP